MFVPERGYAGIHSRRSNAAQPAGEQRITTNAQAARSLATSTRRSARSPRAHKPWNGDSVRVRSGGGGATTMVPRASAPNAGNAAVSRAMPAAYSTRGGSRTPRPSPMRPERSARRDGAGTAAPRAPTPGANASTNASTNATVPSTSRRASGTSRGHVRAGGRGARVGGTASGGFRPSPMKTKRAAAHRTADGQRDGSGGKGGSGGVTAPKRPPRAGRRAPRRPGSPIRRSRAAARPPRRRALAERASLASPACTHTCAARQPRVAR